MDAKDWSQIMSDMNPKETLWNRVKWLAQDASCWSNSFVLKTLVQIWLGTKLSCREMAHGSAGSSEFDLDFYQNLT